MLHDEAHYGIGFKILSTLRSLLSVLFYYMTWSEIFQKVSIKRPGPSQKKMIILFYFRATAANFWSLLNNLVWIFEKVSIKRPGPSQKKSIILFYFRAATANLWALLNAQYYLFFQILEA